METIRVADQYRTNSLSLKPGGSIVKVVYANSRCFVYDKIKYPESYVARIHGKDIKYGKITRVLCNGDKMNHNRILTKAMQKGWA